MAGQLIGKPFRVVVLSGPSGTGKTTIVERLIHDSPVRLVKCVSATTRPPRPGEAHGISYYFLTHEDFTSRRLAGEFLETAEVFAAGYWYGTLKSELERARNEGGWAFLEIDVQGALRVMEQYPSAITIFLEPPSIEVCEQRLRSRGTDSEETIQRRLKKVQDELQLADRYRHRVVNDDLEQAIGTINQILLNQSE
ncbi:MAG: guanylate kinase [Planctomycetes bacterium]|nr:guanylate kinase [Planctomycetota bacterium]